MKIVVTREGRPNMFVPEKESLIGFIREKNFEKIHNMIPSGFMMIGADHEVDSVIEDINRGERLGLFTDPSANMGHGLAVITDNKLECYDIGKITEEDLDITG